jgi:predicted Zn-dependent peptidase
MTGNSNIKKITLPNGLQIIYEKAENSIPVTSIQLFCNIGNIHFPRRLSGITHFIEHMCFKGTKEHPDFIPVLLDFEESGAEYNGYSTPRFTTYIVKCPDSSFVKSLKNLSEEVLTSSFDKKKFKKEEKVVIEENVINADNPNLLLNIMTNSSLYENTPFQYPTDHISYHRQPFDYNEVVEIYRQHYVPSNMLLSIVSNLPFSKILAIIKKTHLATKPSSNVLSLHQQTLPLLMRPPIIDGPKYKLQKKSNLNAIYLNLSFQTCNQYAFEDKHILNLLTNILCNSLASRLSKVLRQHYGLVYSIGATTDFNESGGEFTIMTKFDSASFIKKGAPSVLPILISELNKLNRNGVTQSEVTTFKHNLQGHLALELENIDNQAKYNGLYFLLIGDPSHFVPYSQIYDKCYASITRGQINACIRKYFCLERLCFSVVGHNIPPLALLERECNKLQNKIGK